jgi:hypothetical protein
MPQISADNRNARRRELDEQIAAEPRLPIPDATPSAPTLPMETRLALLHASTAIAGIVENGVVVPLDATAKLPEHAHVLIVTTSGV